MLQTELLAEGFPGIVGESKHRVEPGEGVHQWLGQEAWRYYNSQITGAELGRYIGQWEKDGVFENKEQVTVLDGLRDEDKGFKPPLFQGGVGGFDADSPSLRHFCASGKDMYTGYLLFERYDSCMTQAENIWSAANDNMLARYQQTDKTRAYYYLGHVAHLLADMTIPAHTHNDPHGTDLVSMHDSYEQDYAADHFQEFHFDDAIGPLYILKNLPITVPDSLYGLFQGTADYVDDYDSNHADGEYSKLGLDACLFPGDYPAALLHRPGEALHTGGGSSSTMPVPACAIIADDLMYWAVRRTALLFRLFYAQVDTEPFQGLVALTSNGASLSENESAPTLDTGPKTVTLNVYYLSAGGPGFPVSGIVKSSCVLHYVFMPAGGVWSGEHTLPVPQGAGKVSLPTDEGTYKVWVTAENGAGRAADIRYGYFQAPEFGIIKSPQGGRFERGDTLRLSVQVSGASENTAYEWQKDGLSLPGENESSYVVYGLVDSDAGNYRCIITDTSQAPLITPPAHIQVVPENSLPAVGHMGLLGGMAALLLAGILLVHAATRHADTVDTDKAPAKAACRS